MKLYSEISQYLKDLYKPTFFKQKHDVIKSCLGKRYIQSPKCPINFNVTEYEKLTGNVSDSMSRNYHLLGFGVMQKKYMHNYLNRLLK